MKKTISIALCLILAAACLFVSCKQPEPEVPAGDGLVHISEFSQIVGKISAAKGSEAKTLVLDGDLIWDGDTYKATTPFDLDLTGLTIDLNGHSISGIVSNAFKPTGDTFIIKNGSLLLQESTSTYQKCISIGFSETLTYTDYSGAEAQAKAVTFDGVTTNGCLYLGGGVFRIKDCTINSVGTQTRGICSYSAYVDVTGSTIKSNNAEVAIHVRDTVLNLSNGTVVDSAIHGIQAYYKSKVTTSGAVTIKGKGANYDIYLNYGPNVLTIGGQTVIQGGTKGVFAITYGDAITIANGAAITGPQGTVEPKYTAASYTKASGTASTNGYVGWSNGNKNTTQVATITDNRVFE